MSLYKTARCRHFDGAGTPIKPYCSQGNKCRFIHPNDYQWTRVKRRNDSTPSPQSREFARPKGKSKPQFSPQSPHRQRSPPGIPQTDLFKRKQKDAPREPDHRDWPPVQNGDRRRESDPWLYTRERGGLSDQGYLKRPNDESEPYPNQRPRLFERTAYGPTSRDSAHPPPQKDETACPVSRVSALAREPGPKSKVSDTFHRLAKLCCEIVQDTCFLDREEDKLKAFTGLSSELSRVVPGAAMAVSPALATVINGHSQTRERIEQHAAELEALWKALFSTLEDDISKVIDSRLEQAMALLDKERGNAIQAIMRSQKAISGGLPDGTTGPRQQTDSLREAASDRTASLSEGGTPTLPLNGRPAVGVSLEEARHHGSHTSLSLVPTQEMDLGTSLRIVLGDMKVQMDRQTRAIELLAKENLQLKSTTEFVPPQVVPPESPSSSPRKPSII